LVSECQIVGQQDSDYAPPSALAGEGEDGRLAKQYRSRGASSHPSYATPLSRIVTTALDAVVHAGLQRANAGGSIYKRRFGMDCLA